MNHLSWNCHWVSSDSAYEFITDWISARQPSPVHQLLVPTAQCTFNYYFQCVSVFLFRLYYFFTSSIKPATQGRPIRQKLDASFFLQQIRKLLSLWTISRFIHWITIIDMWNMWNISLPWTQAESFYAHAFAVKRMLLMLKNLDRPNYVTICIIYWFTVLSTWNRIYGEDYRAVR